MMAATILCLLVQVPNGTTAICADGTPIRIAGLKVGELVLGSARDYLTRLIAGRKISCLPAGNEESFIAAKCALPDGRDVACTLIQARAAIRADTSWRRYGLENCESKVFSKPAASPTIGATPH